MRPRSRPHDPDRDATWFDRFAVAFACALVGGLLACVLFVVVAVTTGDYAAAPLAFAFPIAAMGLAGFALGSLAVDSVLLCLATIAALLGGAFGGAATVGAMKDVDPGEGPERPVAAGLFIAVVVGVTLGLMLGWF